MARAKTKEELIHAATKQYDTLMQLVDTMSEEEQGQTFDFDPQVMGKEAHWERDHNIRDVFAHLYEWHQLVLVWVASNMNDISQPFLPSPYNWKTYGDMNVMFYQRHQDTAYKEIRAMLQDSHKQVMDLMETFTNEQLFEKERYPWVGGTTLGSYFTSATSSHYLWAIKKIKIHKKSLGG